METEEEEAEAEAEEVTEVVTEEEEAEAEEEEEIEAEEGVSEVDRKPPSSPTDWKAYIWLKDSRMLLSPRTWYQARASIMKRE